MSSLHSVFFLFNDTATTEIYTLSLHDALPISLAQQAEEVFSSTGIRELRRKPVFTTPNYFPPTEPATDEPRVLPETRHCYVWKEHYQTVHHFYDQLCPSCAEPNFAKRPELAELTGRVRSEEGRVGKE